MISHIASQTEKTRRALAVVGLRSNGEFIPGPMHSVLESRVEQKQDVFASQLNKLDSKLEELALSASNVENIKREINAAKEGAKALEAERAKVKDEEGAVPALDGAVSRERDEARKRVESRRRDLERALRGGDDQADSVEALALAMRLYKRIGLGIKKLPGGKSELKVMLRLIDPSKPEREFSFVVHIDDNELYHIRDVRPPVSGLELLVAQLNDSNDFSGFVRSMRKRFQQSV